MSSKQMRIAKIPEGNFKGMALPADILNDLQEGFNYYDKEASGYITPAHFINILQNFGYHKLSLKERTEDLKKADSMFHTVTHVPFDFVKHIVTTRWNKSGREEEANECFRIFDKRDRNMINFQDIKHILSRHLEFPITDTDVTDFMEECDPSGNGHVTGMAFKKLY